MNALKCRTLGACVAKCACAYQWRVKINWEQAMSTGSLHSYPKLVKATLVKIVGRCYNIGEELNDEI